MLQRLLMLFTTEEKAISMLENPIIQMIFMALFVMIFITIILHLCLYVKIRKVRNYIQDTKRMDIEPLQSFKKEFEERQIEQAFKTETFVQEKFSSWKLFGLPIIGLIKMVQMTISVFILLGVLGTFIGLTISLGSINGVEEELIENVAGVLKGIDIAFYTSIVGMSFSLMMTVLVRLLNTEYLLTDTMLLVESHLESHEQHGMHKMISVSEMIHSSLQGVVGAFDGFKDYTAGLKESARDLASFNAGLSENLTNFQELFQDMKLVTEGFSEGTTALNSNFDQLLTYFKKGDQKNERLMSLFEKSYENMQTVSNKQLESFASFDESVAEVKSFSHSLVEEQGVMSRNMMDISHGTKELVTMMGQQKAELKHIFGDDLRTKLGGMTTYLEQLARNFTEFGDAIRPLPRALEVIEQAQAGQKQLLTDRLQELTNFNQTFNQHLKNHATESAAFERNIRESTASFGQMGQQNNQFLLEIEKIIARLEGTFNGRDQQLHANIDMVKDSFSSYASSLEGTLAQKLDTLIRNIDSTIHTQQDEIKREFIEMRRISEETHNNNQRTQQQLLHALTEEIAVLTRQLGDRKSVV